MEVEFDGAFHGGYAPEDRLPEIVALFGNSAFAMGSKRESADGRAGFEYGAQRIPAIRRVVLGIQAGDLAVGVGRIVEIVSVCPDSNLEVHAAFDGFFADEAKSIQVALPFRVIDSGNPDVIARDSHEERIREVQVGIAHLAREIVADAEGQAEAIETMRGEHCQVFPPAGFIVEPGFVFHFAHEWPDDAADSVRRLLFDGAGAIEGARLADLIGKVEDGPGESLVVGSGDCDCIRIGSDRQRACGAPRACECKHLRVPA